MSRTRRPTIQPLKSTQPKETEVSQTTDQSTDDLKTDSQEQVQETQTTDTTAQSDTPAVGDQSEESDQETDQTSTDTAVSEEPQVQVVTQDSSGTVEVVVQSKNYGVEFDATTQKMLEELEVKDPQVFAHFHTLFDYIVRFAPGKPVDPQQCANGHASIYSAMKNIIASQANFTQAFTCLLFVIKAYSETGAFAMTHATRYMDYSRMSQQNAKGYTMLINFLREVAPVPTRKQVLKVISMEKSLQPYLSADSYRMIQNYFESFMTK